MLPALKVFDDDKIITTKDIIGKMVLHFNISEEEQKEKIPSGRAFLYYNRIAWAITYLKMGGLIESPQRSKYILTQRGKDLLKNPPEKISISFLKQYPDFKENRNPSKFTNKTKDIEEEDDDVTSKTPDELIEIGVSQINNELSKDLMNYIKNSTPYFFEQLVLDLLISIGYGGADTDNSQLTPRGSDEGIDGIIKEDKLGLDKIYIQAKKWENTVGRPEIQKFVGALQGKRAKKGIFITTSNFSKEALEYASNLDISVVLIDGITLTNLMIENDLGVSVKYTYKIKKIDTDYFEEQ
jgi:restriction system protein